MIAIKKAICYARYSSTNQNESSITAQLRSIYDYAAKNDITIIKVYADEAQSGTSDDRTNFQDMMTELPLLKPDFVLVHKLDRFARNKYDAAYYRREIKKINARLVAVEQDFGEGPEAELMEGILEGFAEYFSSNLGREIKKGMTENAMQGKHCGGIPPLGYDLQDGKYIINEDEATAVKLIYTRKIEGYTYNQIRDELNKLGYKSKKGRPFASNSIHDILRNEKYAGTFVLRKTSPQNSRKATDPSKTMRIENALPVIIDADTFARVQELLDRAAVPRNHADKPMRYLLTGIIKCGVCGGAMSGVTVRSKKDAPTRGYYQCGKAKRTGECPNKKRYRKDHIENDVLDYIEQSIKSIKDVDKTADKIIKELKNKYPKDNSKKAELKKALNKAEKEFINLSNAIAAGADPRFLAERMNEAGNRRQQLQEELNRCGNEINFNKQDIISLLLKKQSITFNREDEASCLIAIGETVKEVMIFPDATAKIKPRGL